MHRHALALLLVLSIPTAFLLSEPTENLANETDTGEQPLISEVGATGSGLGDHLIEAPSNGVAHTRIAQTVDRVAQTRHVLPEEPEHVNELPLGELSLGEPVRGNIDDKALLALDMPRNDAIGKTAAVVEELIAPLLWWSGASPATREPIDCISLPSCECSLEDAAPPLSAWLDLSGDGFDLVGDEASYVVSDAPTESLSREVEKNRFRAHVDRLPLRHLAGLGGAQSFLELGYSTIQNDGLLSYPWLWSGHAVIGADPWTGHNRQSETYSARRAARRGQPARPSVARATLLPSPPRVLRRSARY